MIARAARLGLLVWLGVASPVACASGGAFTWVDELPGTETNGGGFVIRDTDTVSVRVFNQEALSTKERVRPDGKITVPLAGEVMARGKKPAELAKELELKLKSVVVAPVVTVSVEQSAQIAISVIGEVKNPGAYNIEPGSSLLVVLANAGGLSDYASTDRIFVVRKGLDRRVRFRFSDLREGDKRSLAFVLLAGDVVVVE